jgi:hypothetical protein
MTQGKRGLRLLKVGKGGSNTGNLLISLVPLASEQNHIADIGFKDSTANRFGAVDLDFGPRCAGQNLVDDALWHFAARVVAGHHNPVGQAFQPLRPSADACPLSRSPPQPKTAHRRPPRALPHRARPAAHSPGHQGCERNRPPPAARHCRQPAPCGLVAASMPTSGAPHRPRVGRHRAARRRRPADWKRCSARPGRYRRGATVRQHQGKTLAEGRIEQVFGAHQRRKVTFWLADA